MLRLAILTTRGRLGTFTGALIALLAASVLAMAWGMQLESILRTHAPVERYAAAEAAAAFLGLGAYFGKPVSQNGKGHILGHIKDLGRRFDDPTARIYQTTHRQTFHTDSADIVALRRSAMRNANTLPGWVLSTSPVRGGAPSTTSPSPLATVSTVSRNRVFDRYRSSSRPYGLASVGRAPVRRPSATSSAADRTSSMGTVTRRPPRSLRLRR